MNAGFFSQDTVSGLWRDLFIPSGEDRFTNSIIKLTSFQLVNYIEEMKISWQYIPIKVNVGKANHSTV